MLLLITLGCRPADPAANALTACKALPALELDAAGQAYAQKAVDPAELDRWRSIVDYQGPMKEIGPPGFGVIRANSDCEAAEPEGDVLRVIRYEPDISGLDPFDAEKVWEQPKVERELRLEALPDGRVRVGLEKAWAEADRARALPPAARAAALEALHGWFPDPMLILEVRQARTQEVDALLDVLQQGGLPPALPVEGDLPGVSGGGE